MEPVSTTLGIISLLGSLFGGGGNSGGGGGGGGWDNYGWGDVNNGGI